jgi:hypothetical protein
MFGHIERPYGISQVPQNIPQKNAELSIFSFSRMFVVFRSMIAGIFILIFLWVANSIVTIILTHTFITGVVGAEYGPDTNQ